jgi:CelD/BcsL family acetyltransferase involved in cellulose biosynthesis
MTFDEYWAARPSQLRNTAKRRAKSANLDLVIHDRFDPQAWDDYESVYNASWKPAEGSPEFMRRLAEQEGAAGTLRLGLAYQEGRAVAAQLWIVEGGVATIHKLAYREDARQHSPGTILSMEMYRRVIDDDRVEMIDFGIGNEGYKADWMQECVPLYALTAYDAKSLRGLLGFGRAAAAKLVRLARSRYARLRQGGKEWTWR